MKDTWYGAILRRVIVVVVLLGMIATAASGCQNRAGYAYEKSKADYQACVQAKGAAACSGERAVMDADAQIYASTTPTAVVRR